MMTKTAQLDNGVKIAMRSTPQFQTVGIAVSFRYGSIDDNPRVGGAAHYLEHMLFKGTKKRTWREIIEEARNYGMEQNAFTNKESTTYFLWCYKGYFERAVDLLSDQVRNSVFPEKEFELERGPIINENLLHSDMPIYMFYDFLPKVLYSKHPARLSVGGDEKSIRRTTREDLLRIYDSHYSPNNMFVSVYGGVGTAKIISTMKKYFGDFEKKGAAPKRNTAREAQVKKELTVWKKGIKQTRIGMGFKTKGFVDAGMREMLSVSVIYEVLKNRLYDEIREKRGLSYDPSASYSLYSTFGFLAAGAGIEPVNLEKAKEILLKEFEKLQDGEITKSELRTRQRGYKIRMLTGREDTLSTALSMSEDLTVYNEPTLTERFPNLITSVSIDDFRKYCSKYIDVDRYGFVALRPKK